MDIHAIGPWFFDLDQTDHAYASAREVAEAVQACQPLAQGRLAISYDDGPRPWWERFLGLAPRYVSGFAALEWADSVASLTFWDENWSEYRALGHAPPERARRQTARGDSTPFVQGECLDKDRAFEAWRKPCALACARTGWPIDSSSNDGAAVHQPHSASGPARDGLARAPATHSISC